MSQKTLDRPSMSEVLCAPRLTKVKSKFLDEIDARVNWQPISTLLNKKLLKQETDVAGRPAFPPIMLFKALLLGVWYGLSDEALEAHINDSISASRFLGIGLEDLCPDHTTIWRFRQRLSEDKLHEKLLKILNKQLQKHRISVSQGVLIDASIVPSPYLPKDTNTFVKADDRDPDREEEDIIKEDSYQKEVKQKQHRKDSEGRWLKKGSKSYYGYKKHVATDKQGNILGLITTPANVSDTKMLDPLLNHLGTLPKGTRIYADKGYASSANRNSLKQREYRDGIMHKRKKGEEELPKLLKRKNRLITQSRYVIERTFGGIKRWFCGGLARYYGLERMHTQNLLEAMAYNLYRLPGLPVPEKAK